MVRYGDKGEQCSKDEEQPRGKKVEAILCAPLWFVKLLEKPPEKVRVPKWRLNLKSERQCCGL